MYIGNSPRELSSGIEATNGMPQIDKAMNWYRHALSSDHVDE